MSHSSWISRLVAVAFIVSLNSLSLARTVELDSLTFIPATSAANTIQLTLSTDVAGSDSDMTTISGSVMGSLDFGLQGTSVVPSGLTLTDGQIALSDINFSFLFGLIQVRTMGIRGVPSTISAPSPVINGSIRCRRSFGHV